MERALYHPLHDSCSFAFYDSVVLAGFRFSNASFLPSSHFTVLGVRSLGNVVDSWGVVVTFRTNPFCVH